MFDQKDYYNVLLPKQLIENAENKEHYEKLVLEYMQRYPHYEVKNIKMCMAVCVRVDFDKEERP